MREYYKPKREEFHIGFEYEIFYEIIEDFNVVSKGKWHKERFEGNNLYPDNIAHPSFTAFKESKIRVKYFDEDDIESLGFKVYHRKDHFTGSYLGHNFFVEYNFKDKTVCIYENNFNEHYLNEDCNESPNLNVYEVYPIRANKLVVKNKSELERILKQGGII